MKDKKITLNVGRKEFLDWYIGDENTITIPIKILREKGMVTVQDLVKDMGYIPLRLIANSGDIIQDDLTESDEIEDPTEKYNIKIV